MFKRDINKRRALLTSQQACNDSINNNIGNTNKRRPIGLSHLSLHVSSKIWTNKYGRNLLFANKSTLKLCTRRTTSFCLASRPVLCNYSLFGNYVTQTRSIWWNNDEKHNSDKDKNNENDRSDSNKIDLSRSSSHFDKTRMVTARAFVGDTLFNWCATRPIRRRVTRNRKLCWRRKQLLLLLLLWSWLSLLPCWLVYSNVYHCVSIEIAAQFDDDELAMSSASGLSPSLL